MRSIKVTLEIGKRETKLPYGIIKLNDKVVHEGQYTQEEYEMTPVIGPNILEISLTNKNPKDTKLLGNKIVEDLFVRIKDITCTVTNESVGNLDIIGNYVTEKKENLKTYGYLSYNGKYIFKFDYPFFIFSKNKLFCQ